MTSPLISVGQLRDLVAPGTEHSSPVTLLDVRYRMGGPSGPEEFAAGHIPGAAYVDLDQDLAQPPGRGGRHPLPAPERFVAAMRRAGVSHALPVVVYDDWQGHAAARAWWLLRHYGHRHVRLLDGGWTAWQQAGDQVETGAQRHRDAGDFQGHPGAMPVVHADQVPAVDVVVDARGSERYRGDTEPVDPVAGHIPGAVNVPTASNLRPDGTFRPANELAHSYAQAGAGPGADIAVYCGSGVTACHDLVALEVAGVSAALYPGSWSEWVVDPARPVEVTRP